MDFASLSIEVLSSLFFISILAGFLDTLAGGGGLITLPALIISGVPPLSALGTNKLQGSMGTATATVVMLRKKKVSWHDVKGLMVAAFIGSVAGSIAVQFINTDILSFVIPLVLVFISVFFLLLPRLEKIKMQSNVSSQKYKNVVVPLIGCYDGMFGPGTGSFFSLTGILFRGHEILSSVAEAKPLNFSTNIASLFVFLVAGKVVWAVGVSMMLGQAIGAWLGAHCLFKVNPEYLRLLIVFMCLLMLFKYVSSLL